jgi:hypothetical protein
MLGPLLLEISLLQQRGSGLLGHLQRQQPVELLIFLTGLTG